MSNKLWVAHETPAKTFGPTKVSIDGCEYVDDFLKEIKKEFALSVPSSRLTLYTSDGITEISPVEEIEKLNTLDVGPYKPLIVAVKVKRPLVSDQEITSQLKKRRLSISQSLIETSGSDFTYSDRSSSMKVLADSLQKRHLAWKQKKSDQNLHPIPYLAEGPGSGKSRFLQELPSSFLEFVQQNESYSEEFKSEFKTPVIINISFSNGTRYLPTEAQAIDIQKSVCLRILYLFQSGYSNFESFYKVHQNEVVSFSNTLTKLGADTSCIILGIDEVNMVYDVGGKDRLRDLFCLVGGISFYFSHFFVPVLAGAIIGPMNSATVKSRHPPLQIPLPLLSFESCLDIFEKKKAPFSTLIRKNHKFRQLISDCGGHCRSLEILHDCISDFYCENINWKGIIDSVQCQLIKRYEIGTIPLGTAIAFSLLRLDASETDEYPEIKNSMFQDLEEKGLIKFENGKIQISHFFIGCFLISNHTASYSKFWKDLLIGEGDDFWWQDWKVFNRNYISFRLSLYAYLKVPSVSLKKLFSGAKLNIPADIKVKIPPFETLQISKIDYRYPSTKAPEFEIGDNVLNADGAPFDSFLFLETTANPLLLAFQMKLANNDSQTGQVISDATANSEFTKINDSVATYLPGTDFVCVILGHCEGTFDEKMLPSKCVVISREEQLQFYGPYYYERLNNRF